LKPIDAMYDEDMIGSFDAFFCVNLKKKYFSSFKTKQKSAKHSTGNGGFWHFYSLFHRKAY
jgi:hypothetical protein